MNKGRALFEAEITFAKNTSRTKRFFSLELEFTLGICFENLHEKIFRKKSL